MNAVGEANTLIKRQMLVDGAWVDALGGETLTVENPSRRTPLGVVPRARAADVDRAVAAAEAAFRPWSRMVPRERGRLLMKIADALDARHDELATILAAETGNAIRTQARPEATAAADTFRYFGGLASELKGETMPLGENHLAYTRREPIGVVGAIVPWNRPASSTWCRVSAALQARRWRRRWALMPSASPVPRPPASSSCSTPRNRT